jgi:hypothetical protein
MQRSAKDCTVMWVETAKHNRAATRAAARASSKCTCTSWLCLAPNMRRCGWQLWPPTSATWQHLHADARGKEFDLLWCQVSWYLVKECTGPTGRAEDNVYQLWALVRAGPRVMCGIVQRKITADAALLHNLMQLAGAKRAAARMPRGRHVGCGVRHKARLGG